MSEHLNGHYIDDGESMPRALAELFTTMTSDNQAEFFDRVAYIAGTWTAASALQWRHMQHHLSARAKRIIDEIKDHTDEGDDE